MRTPEQIIAQTNELARQIYALRGYRVGEDHKFYEFSRQNYHPHERFAWDCACAAQDLLTGTEVRDAFAELDIDYDGD